MPDFYQYKPMWDRKAIRKGESNPYHKLSESLVKQMRSSYPEKNTRQIKEWLETKGVYVSLGCVSNVIFGLTWKHVK